MTVEYGWRSRYAHPSVPAQAVGEELERICKQSDGVLDPKIIVEEARDENSPLHPAFEWDDAEAAERWRLDQARGLARALSVKVVDTPDAEPVRAFVRLSSDEDRGYHAIPEVLASPLMRKQWVEQALREAEQWWARYEETLRDVEEFAGFKQSVSSAKERLRAA